VRAQAVLWAALLLCAPRGWAEALRVPIAVAEPAGIARTAEPVTVGVGLPAGRVRTPDALWIAGPDGRAVPSQRRVLERWPDGSARWLLVDFLASAGAHATASYGLRDGKAPAPPRGPALRTSLDAGGTRVATGALDVVVTRDGPLVRTARPEGIEVGRPILVADDFGGTEPGDGRLMVETEGPVRTEWLRTGRHAGDLAWEVRIAVFAGSPAVRLQLTLTSLASRPYTRIASWLLPVGGGFGSGTFGVGGGARRVALDARHDLVQLDARTARLDDEPVDTTGDGWARASGERSVVTAVRRWFAEEWPQGLSLSRTRLGLDLLAGAHGRVELGIGAAKTFELWLVVETPEAAGDAAALATRLQRPLVVSVEPAWTAASRALPNAVAPDGPGVADLLPRLQTAIGRYLARNRAERWDDGPPTDDCEARTGEHERVGAYGALNWGDWNFPGYRDRSEGCDAWGNLEYDLPQVLGLAFAATGARTSWEAFVAAARHYRDVDVVHHAPGHEEWRGINHPHKVKHFAVESKNKVDLGHTWLEGLVTHYRLTGEVRSLEAARGIADVLVRVRSKAGNPRQFGWPMIALAAAADATGDARYREAALSYAEAAVARNEPTPAAGDWKMGILADGVAAVHALTHDERLRDWLVRYGDAFAAEPARWEDDPRYALPLGYLAALTGDARHRAAGLATVDEMPIGDWGKTLAISGRTAFRILGPLGPAATRARAAPPRPSARAPTPRSRSPRAPARPRVN
jgi:hypothetical protein